MSDYSKNKIQPVVNPETSIVFFDELWDVGVRVVKWWEDGGYDGYSTKQAVVTEEDRKTGKVTTRIIKGKRYGGSFARPRRALRDVTQFVVHHTGGYLPGVCYNTLHNERKLSVQFILDDKGVIYQTLDAKEIAWQAGGQNRCSIGVECCLYPKAAENPEAYRAEKCKRLGLAPHEIGSCYIQSQSRKVFLMPETQVENLAFLLAGAWFARNRSVGLGDRPPRFPSRYAGEGAPPDVNFSPSHLKHEGLVLHANISPRKWDAAGVDVKRLEARVAEIYAKQQEGGLNV